MIARLQVRLPRLGLDPYSTKLTPVAALAVDVVPNCRRNVYLFALSMADIIGFATNHAWPISSGRGGIGCGLDRVKLHYHLGTSASSSTISSYPITRVTSFHSLSMSAGGKTSAISCDAKKPYGVVKPVQPKPVSASHHPLTQVF